MWYDGSGENMAIEIISQQNPVTNGAQKPLRKG